MQTQITAPQLKAALDSGQELFLLDLRNRDEFAKWRIESARPVPMLNTPYFEVLETAETDDLAKVFADFAAKEWAETLPRDGMIVVVCAKGGTSLLAVEGLRQLGYEAVSLEGGMVAWGNFYDFKPVVQDADLRIYQVARPARGCLSYLVAAGGQAVVVDPLRHIEQYVDFAHQQGLTITAVLDTHGHADHISGGPAMAERLSIPYHVHPYDAIHPIDVMPATIPYEPLRAGQVLDYGAIRLEVLHIPGHTLGNLAYLVNGKYLLSGDSIFIESIARPDLGGRGDGWSPLHFRSLSQILQLPDETLVLPGHFSHPAEANEQGLYARTLGDLKARNEGLRMVQQGEAAFVDYLLQSLPTFPPQYVEIKRVNAGLVQPDEEKAAELELGRNICALSKAYDH